MIIAQYCKECKKSKRLPATDKEVVDVCHFCGNTAKVYVLMAPDNARCKDNKYAGVVSYSTIEGEQRPETIKTKGNA